MGTFNALVLETLHEVSHMLSFKGHHYHSYAFGHELSDYSSLEGMAGHSHKALQELKELLEANKQKEEQKDSKNEKFDKHFSDVFQLAFAIMTLEKKQTNWSYIKEYGHWFPNVHTPPPKA
ncbi:hypothetical protein ACNR9Q_05880 [Maribacter sp. X9]|uniref:hypothetical protein n=1 Tax=Maribacter sp. X9 TaxID=3402159 RepID=UPI003AF397E7